MCFPPLILNLNNVNINEYLFYFVLCNAFYFEVEVSVVLDCGQATHGSISW